jgi:hypothetical protein
VIEIVEKHGEQFGLFVGKLFYEWLEALKTFFFKV